MDEFRSSTKTQVFTPNHNDATTTDPVIDLDIAANDICFPFNEYDSYLSVNKDYPFNSLSLDNRFGYLKRNYAYTLSIWLKIDKET